MSDVVQGCSFDDGAFVCVVTSTGTARCWGRDNDGQLGIGFTTSTPQPITDVVRYDDFVKLACGERFVCGVRTGGEVACWGYNFYRVLGDGSSTARTATPVDVLGLTDAVDIAAASRSVCALRSNGTVVCWGRGSNGQLGDGTLTDTQDRPTQVLNITDAESIVGDGNVFFALREGGRVYGWGFPATSGVLGNPDLAPSFTSYPTPLPVLGFE